MIWAAMATRLKDFAEPPSHRRTLLMSSLHVALIWLLAAVVVWQNYNQSVESWKTSARSIALAVAAHAAQAQYAADLVLSNIADALQDEDIQTEQQFRQLMGERRFYDALRDRVVGLPQIGTAAIVATDGEVLNSLAQWPPIKLHVADREAFKGAMAAVSPQPVIGVPVRNTRGTWQFFLARKLTSKSGETLGVIAVGLNIDYFAAFFRRLTIGTDSWVSLFRSDSTMLATSLPDESLLAKPYPDSFPLRMIREGRAGTATVTNSRVPGNPVSSPTRITAVAEVEGFPAYVAVAVGESAYLLPWLHRTYLTLGIALLLTLLTALAGLRIVRLIDRSEAARRSEAERQVLAAIVDTPSALTAVVAPSGKVLHCNTRFGEVLGRKGGTEDALLNSSLKGAQSLLDFARAGKDATTEADLEIEHEGGQTRRLHFSASRQSLPDTGECVVLVGHDETQRHQAQQAVAMSARLVTLGEITTSIAHEVSQPLNVIRMAAQNALVESKPEAALGSEVEPMSDAEYRSFAATKFERIVSQVDRAADILSRMRIFGRRPGEDTSSFDASAACRNAIALMLPRLRRDGIKVREDYPDLPVMTKGPQAMMEQVVIHLVRNAREALLYSQNADKTIEVSVRAAPIDRVLMRIADNGPGVPAAIRERIFEPFFTTKANNEHPGLGLALSFGAVRDSAGKLTLLSGTAGAAFQIDLPADMSKQPKG